MFERNEVLDTEQTDRPEYVSVVHSCTEEYAARFRHRPRTGSEHEASPHYLAIGREAAAGAGKGAIN